MQFQRHDGLCRKRQAEDALLNLGISEWHGPHAVGPVEGVAVGNALCRQYLTHDLAGCDAGQVDGDFLCFGKVYVGEREVHAPFLVARGGGAEQRQTAAVAHADGGARKVYGQVGGILMHAVHLENVVGGCQHHAVVLRQNHGLEDVDYLGYVRHLQAVGVFMEDVEREGGHEGIAQGERLIKLNQIAIQQMKVLEGDNNDRKLLK